MLFPKKLLTSQHTTHSSLKGLRPLATVGPCFSELCDDPSVCQELETVTRQDIISSKATWSDSEVHRAAISHSMTAANHACGILACVASASKELANQVRPSEASSKGVQHTSDQQKQNRNKQIENTEDMSPPPSPARPESL